MRRLVILRPEPGATLSAERASRMGFDDIVTAPLFKVRPVEWEAPSPERFDALLLTSANAARHAGDGLERLKTLPVHTVGDATASAARAAGLMVETVGEGGVEQLLEGLPEELRLLHLSGRQRRIPKEPKQTIVSLPVYSSVEREHPRNIEALPDSVACVHSPRAGARLAELAEREGYSRSGVAIAAISRNAADACGEGWEEVAVAKSPDDPTLLALALRLCQKSE